jgi:ribonuclease-3
MNRLFLYLENLIQEKLIVKNYSLFEQAFTHESFNEKNSYERLEFLGDSILGFVVANYLFLRFKKHNESFLTEMKIKIVNSNTLSWLCQCIKLRQFIKMQDNLNHNKIFEDVFESFIGAFYLEFGMQKTNKMIIGILENPNFLDFTDLIMNDYNYKKKLMISMQKNLDGRLPVFHTLNISDSNLFHIVVCHPNGQILGIGVSKTIKLAQQSACKMALDNYIPAESEYHKLVDKKKFEKPFDHQINENNINISPDVVIEIWKRYGINSIQEINDITNYQSSFIHKSFINNSDCRDSKFEKFHSNERLNFLGNSILMYLITDYLYNMYPHENEGFLTKIKTNEIQNKNLYQYCQLLNLNKYLVLNKNDEFNRNNPNHSEQLFCSFVAAMFLDQGFELTRQWVNNLWKKESKMVEFTDENYKHQLLLKIQENPIYKFYKYPFPTYKLLPSETNFEKKVFTVQVFDPNGKIIGQGQGKTKKDAEQMASKNALVLGFKHGSNQSIISLEENSSILPIEVSNMETETKITHDFDVSEKSFEESSANTNEFEMEL